LSEFLVYRIVFPWDLHFILGAFKGGRLKFFRWYNTVLVIISCFLQWIQPKIFVTNITGFQTFDGKLVLGLGLIGFLAASCDFISKGERFAGISGIIGFIIIIYVSMLFFDYFRREYVLGPGIYLVALGSLQLTGAYIAALLKRRAKPLLRDETHDHKPQTGR